MLPKLKTILPNKRFFMIENTYDSAGELLITFSNSVKAWKLIYFYD